MTVIAIFDVGKTNKKLLLFDEQYLLVQEETSTFEEINDEDGFACEDVQALTKWVIDSFDKLTKDDRFDVKAVNFSAYGASFVYVDTEGKILTPLYNYLKPYPAELQHEFYKKYGGESIFSKQTASPVLGNLNSGMQLYRIKNEQPAIFKKIKFALHLPQYLSYLLCNKATTDITAIGCHTNLWHFQKNSYHQWVSEEGIEKCFAPIFPCDTVIPFAHDNKSYVTGIGLHDSSAALIPYLAHFKEPFILLSTGTWSISLNPFNHTELSDEELRNDCLCYLTYEAKKVKASRLFIGHAHEQQVKILATFFNKPLDYFTSILYNSTFIENLPEQNNQSAEDNKTTLRSIVTFNEITLDNFSSYEQAYHHFMFYIVQQQVKSTRLILENTPVQKMYVDGGFSKNVIFMKLLAAAFPNIQLFAATVPQATALGAALVIHHQWNNQPLPANLVELKPYSFTNKAQL